MFKNLTSFSYKRNWKEAVGFYLVYLILGVILSGIIAGIIGPIILLGFRNLDISQAKSQGFATGQQIGTYTIIMFVLIISGLLLKSKKLFKNFWYLVLALLGVILTVFGGLLLGLIIPAFITTKE